MVEAVGECVTEVGERMVLEGEGRGRGEMGVLAALCIGDERERMEDCGTGWTSDGWELGVECGEEAGEGVEEREGCFMAERRGWDC
jgi:hypothetical protein